MSKYVKYFIWKYQQKFRVAAETLAAEMLDEFLSSSDPNITLVGFDAQTQGESGAWLVEPDDSPFQPNVFSNANSRAHEILASDRVLDAWPSEAERQHDHPEGNVAPEFPSRPIRLWPSKEAADHYAQKEYMKALAVAVREAVELNVKDSDLITFCSSPGRVEGKLVFVLLQFSRADWARHYHLQKRYSSEGDPRSVSLFSSIIDRTLNAFVAELNTSDPGIGPFIRANRHELIRAAADKAMRPVEDAVEEGAGDGLYDICNAISCLRYEGAEGAGAMIFARVDHPDIELEVIFSVPVELRDFGAVRKLLQLTSNSFHLLCDSMYVLGLIKLKGAYDGRAEDLFEVHFRRQFSWDLRHHNRVMMFVQHGMPLLQMPGFDKDKFSDCLAVRMEGLSNEATERLTTLANCVASQSHGALLVICLDAEKEAARLRAQAIPVTPFELTTEKVSRLSAIDGAILIDASATCFAIGVILDGAASDHCTSSRGARYNSAMRYVHSGKGRVAVVKSEDGASDVLPILPRRIAKSEISKAIDNLRALAASGNARSTDYHKALNLLDGYRFYLSPDACAEINALVAVLHERIVRTGAFTLKVAEFSPDPEMTAAYFLQG